MRFDKLMVYKLRQVQNIPDFSDELVVDSLTEALSLLFVVVELWFNVPVNNIAVMSRHCLIICKT